MVALVLITGASSNHHLYYSPPAIIFFWCLKTVLWWILVSRALKKTSLSRHQDTVEKLQSTALLPLGIDFYFLDIKDLLDTIPVMHSFPLLIEFAGIAMYMGYLGIVWTVSWQVASIKSAAAESLKQNLAEQFSLILPALIPYLMLSTGIEIVSAAAPGWMTSLFSSKAAPIVTLAAFTLVLIFFIPPLLRRLWHCTPMADGEMKTEIMEFLEKTGISFKEIYIWPLKGGRACTAAVVGIVPGFRYILLTPALLKYLQAPEVEAVLSHEAEHVIRKHILWYVFFLGVYSVVLYRIIDPVWTWFISRKFFISILTILQDSPEALVSLAAILPMLLLIVLYFRFLMGWFMRNFERQADMSVFRTQGHPWHMISALEKVAVISGGIRDKPSWHHYSIAQRVDFLKKTAEDPDLVRQHSQKLSTARIIFICTAMTLFMLPNILPVEKWKKNADTNIAEAYIEQLKNHGEENAAWYMVMGQLMFKNHEYGRALDAYEKALELDPDNPDILNNMAWLYATADKAEFRKPQMALMLAMKAASLKPESYILDTLAEAFFINGYVQQAIKVEQEALAKTSSNQPYYQRQLARFHEKISRH